MIQLNLLPDIKREYLKARRIQARVVGLAILICIVSIAVVILASAWVFGVQLVQRNSLANDIDKKYKQLSSIKDVDKYVTVQNQLANISSLHTNTAVISRLFDVLPAVNPRAPHNVKISDLTYDAATTTITLKGSTDSFTGLEVFRDTLKNAKVSYLPADGSTTQAVTEALFLPDTIQFVTQGMGKPEDGSQNLVALFTLKLQYNPKLFTRSIRNLSIIVPNKDTTSSKEDSPEVFGQGAKEQ